MNISKIRGAVTVATLCAALVAGPAAVAGATEAPIQPNGCTVVSPDQDVVATTAADTYRTTQTSRYIGSRSTRVYGQRGGTLKIARGRSSSVSGSLQTTVSAEAGAVFAKASASVGISVGLSKTVSTTVGYTWKVPSSQTTGWVEMGSHGFDITWQKGHYGGSRCSWLRTGSGKLRGATSNVQFSHS